MDKPDIAVVVVAAGKGERAGGDVPKQYARIGGRTVLDRTLDLFEGHTTVVVIAEGDRELYDAGVQARDGLLAPVTGGATRQASVLAGLEALAERAPRTVLVHDAARPFASPALIEAVADAADLGALPVLMASSTLLRVHEGRLAEHVPRENLGEAQTPQGFAFAALLAAHRHAEEKGLKYTDDASLMQDADHSITAVPGETSNTKITTAEDLAMAERLLAVPDVRVGHGYDTHRLVPGDHVVLCGVEIAHDANLDGHSDADVGLHALTDALLATIGDGDIGSHFPPSDPQWRGAASDRFLDHAAGRVRATGGTITHVDVTIVCEAPKIGPHRDAMRERLATILALDPGRTSVKATTNEERGFVGRNEGIVALATATVVFA